jgi:hypothetical protein
MAPQGFAIAEAGTLRNRLKFVVCGRKLRLGGFSPQARHEACRSHAHLLGEDPAEISLAHAYTPRQRRDGQIVIQMF